MEVLIDKLCPPALNKERRHNSFLKGTAGQGNNLRALMASGMVYRPVKRHNSAEVNM